jgi:hypothetical protein
VLEASVPASLRVLAPADRLATAALLPAGLCEEYGLAWSAPTPRSFVLAAPPLRIVGVPLFHLAGRVSSSRSLVYAT